MPRQDSGPVGTRAEEPAAAQASSDFQRAAAAALFVDAARMLPQSNNADLGVASDCGSEMHAGRALIVAVCRSVAARRSAQTPVERGKYLVNTHPDLPELPHAEGRARRADLRARSLERARVRRAAVQGDGAPTSRRTRRPASATGATPTSRRRCRRASGRTACSSPRSCRTDFYEIFTPRRSRCDRRLSAHREAGEAADADADLQDRAAAPTFRRAPRSRSREADWPTR